MKNKKFVTNVSGFCSGVNSTGGGGGGATCGTVTTSQWDGGMNGGSGVVIFSHSSSYAKGTCTGSPIIYTLNNRVVYLFANNGSITF